MGILIGFLRTGDYIISEIEVARNISMPFLENVEMVSVMELVTFDKKPLPGNAIFPFGRITGALHFLIEAVYLLDVLDYYQHINNRFSVHPWDGGAADMMNFKQFSPKIFLRLAASFSNSFSQLGS